METHQKLEVWQKAMKLVPDIYVLTRSFPDEEKFGLTNQIRRCAVSIPSNIAEGHARKSEGDFIRFLRIAYGSSAELETQLTLARELEFISQQDFDTLMDSLTGVRMMLNKLMSSIAKS